MMRAAIALSALALASLAPADAGAASRRPVEVLFFLDTEGLYGETPLLEGCFRY